MAVETLDARRLSKANARAIAELLVRVWPKPDKNVEFRQRQMLALGDGYDGPENQAPRCFVVRSSGRVIAHATFLPRTISTTAGLLTIAGLARVCSDPEYRGQKLGEKVVRAVFELIDQGDGLCPVGGLVHVAAHDGSEDLLLHQPQCHRDRCLRVVRECNLYRVLPRELLGLRYLAHHIRREVFVTCKRRDLIGRQSTGLHNSGRDDLV